MKQLEIPLKENRGFRYRFFEMLPGLLSWSVIALPFVLSLINPTWAAYFIVLFMLAWLVKAIGYAVRVSQGYSKLQKFMRLNWQGLLADIAEPKEALIRLRKDKQNSIMRWHYRNLLEYAAQEKPLRPDEIIHAVIMPTYNEEPSVVEPTIQSLLDAYYDVKGKVIFLLAYEERGGEQKERESLEQIKNCQDKFLHAEAVKHPKDLPNEVVGKGGNATFAGRRLLEIIKERKLDPEKVVVTTIDSDNRPHPHYFSAVTYAYVQDEDRKYKSYQPIPMFLNNIWDAPAPMRVIATGNSFWNLIVSSRPHLMRNFSSHAQSLAALIDTDFWSVRTIVEDGHQYWRTYFRYDGQHEVVPIFVPIYQDAVLEDTYPKTLKAQFIQLRRWAYGASDVAYVVDKGYFQKNKIKSSDLFFKTVRLLESHVSLATAPLILAGAAWLPILLAPDAQDAIIAHQLPRIASNINTLIASGILVTMFLSMRMLPPRPPRYKAHRNVFMVIQWVLLPISSIIYFAFSALNSQTRLIFARYLDKFDVTKKAVKQ